MVRWNVQPEVFDAGIFQLRWYWLLFIASFLLARVFVRRVFRAESVSESRVDAIVGYVAFGAVVGARIGRCFFYSPETFLNDPFAILKFWEGGFSSHGAAIGIVLALWAYSVRNPGLNLLFLLDRAAIPVALSGFLIRIGNLIDSKPIGVPTDVPWAFIFSRFDDIPRHPAHLYEASVYLVVCVALYLLYWKSSFRFYSGRLTGTFLISIFVMRIVIEFYKYDVADFDFGVLNVAQVLSMPLVCAGVALLLLSRFARNVIPMEVAPRQRRS